MLKPLLRTLPSLSGNFSINCYINNILKIDDDKYECDIRNAKFTPLDSALYNDPITINLMSGKYEYDVAKYYNKYNNSFYNSNFSFNKLDYQKFDFTTDNYSRDKTFEFGVKREKYLNTNYEFNFYAPIYIDSVDSIPDKFEINIKINDTKTKSIYINIGNKTTNNYLYNYLNRYLEKIDDKVIYCLYNSNQGTYYGINVLNGGLLELKDNTIGSIYNYQYTICNFDNIICEGFQRNNLIVRQVIPLSFSFNLSDLLTPIEYKEAKYSKVEISGKYIYNGIYCDFYDYDINYINYTYKYKEFNSDTGNFEYKDTNNIMDSDFPALKEKRFYKYKYSNKLSPKFCKWKMNYSSDDDPYITNINFAFSKGQNSNYKYGYFPSLINLDKPYAILNNNDFILPYSSNASNYNKTEIDKYKTFLDNNVSGWYNIIDDNTNIFDDSTLWQNVSDNYVYFKGILYNLNNITDTNKYDKFGVFLKPIMSDSENLINIKSKYLLYYDDLKNNCNVNDNLDETSNKNLFNYEGKDNYIKNRTLLYDVDLIQDNNGNICKLNNYYDINIYYKLSNIYKIINTLLPNLYKQLLFKINNILGKTDYSFTSYLKLNIENILNIFTNSGTNIQSSIFYEYFNNIRLYPDYNGLYLNLYISDNISGIKYKLSDIILNNSTYNIDITSNNYTFLWKSEFISKPNLIKIFEECKNDNSIFTNKENTKLLDDIINYLDCYNYIPVKDNESGFICYNFLVNINNNRIIEDSVDDLNKYSDYIYVDSYSLVNFINSYNKINNTSLDPNNILNDEKVNLYCKFISVDHIKEYIKSLSKDENMYTVINTENFKDYIYINERLICDFTTDDIYIKDNFVRLSEIKEFSNISFDDFIDRLTYENNMFIYKYENFIDKDETQLERTIIYLDLYFNKDMYILSNEILNISGLLDLNSKNRVPLYLYKKYDFSNITKTFKLSQSSKNKNVSNINFTCIPLFDNIYKTSKSVDYLYKYFSRNIIKPFSYKTYTYYKYVEYDYPCFTEIDREKYLENILVTDDDLYNVILNNESLKKLVFNELGIKDDLENQIEEFNKIYNESLSEITNCINNNADILNEYIIAKNIKLYKRYDPLNINLVNDSTNINSVYDNIYNINTYTSSDGTKYCYYIINVEFSNDNKSFNILDDSPNIFSFNYINGISINENNYINTIFDKINPFFQKIIFLEYINLINTIITPNMFTLNVNYYPVIYDDGNTEKSYLYNGIFYNINNTIDTDTSVYDIKYYNESRSKKMYLNRYLNQISPYIYKTNIISNVGNLKFKNFDKKVNENNMNMYNINIYKYLPIDIAYTYNPLVEKNPALQQYTEYEYKHFNLNTYYVLEHEITITLDDYFSYNEMLKYETTENALKYFKNYINLILKNNLDDSEILFLFNRYETKYLSNSMKLNSFKTVKLYKLTYKFTLK